MQHIAETLKLKLGDVERNNNSKHFRLLIGVSVCFLIGCLVQPADAEMQQTLNLNESCWRGTLSSWSEAAALVRGGRDADRKAALPVPRSVSGCKPTSSAWPLTSRCHGNKSKTLSLETETDKRWSRRLSLVWDKPDFLGREAAFEPVPAQEVRQCPGAAAEFHHAQRCWGQGHEETLNTHFFQHGFIKKEKRRTSSTSPAVIIIGCNPPRFKVHLNHHHQC